jgi:hypothetical protein
MVEMVLKPKREEGDYPDREPIPEKAVFEAEILSVELRDTRWDDEYNTDEDGNPLKKKEYNFKFGVLDEGEFKDRWVWGSTSNWFADDPRCRLTQWIKAILDEDILPEGFVFDTDNLVNMRCRVIIGAKQRKNGTGIANWVEEVRPSKGVRLAEAPAEEPAAAYDPDEEPF